MLTTLEKLLGLMIVVLALASIAIVFIPDGFLHLV